MPVSHVEFLPSLKLVADVDLQPFDRIVDFGQGGTQPVEVARRLVRGERDHDRFLVGEVVVDRRPPDTGLGRELGHGDRIEAVIGHQRGESLEDALLDQLAVFFDR